MLDLCAARVACAGLDNAVLLRTSALDLPLADHASGAGGRLAASSRRTIPRREADQA
jgi:hypothetical protein